MTPEEQRIAIAEACGWRREPHSVGTRLINPDGWVVNNNYSESWRLPDYLNDLNDPIPCTVLDPFGGSGTTGKVALELARNAVLCDLSPEYARLIQSRTNITPGLALH